MEIHLIDCKEILDFEKESGETLVAWERPPGVGCGRFSVRFKNGEISRGGVLISAIGNGNTIDEALRNFAGQISYQTMVFNAGTRVRTEITIPKLKHTKLLNK